MTWNGDLERLEIATRKMTWNCSLENDLELRPGKWPEIMSGKMTWNCDLEQYDMNFRPENVTGNCDLKNDPKL